jgi:hypothetical protein
VSCRGETARALSLDSIAEDGEAACLEAGECSYLEGTANVTAVPLPYRQMWCVYCYEITHSTPVTVIHGDVQEFQYRVNAPGEWEVIIVLTVDGEEAFHYHNLATILPLADAVANATTSTIEDLEAASVNNTFAFYLQARTWQGINLVRGGDPFQVQFAGQTLSATSDQITYVVRKPSRFPFALSFACHILIVGKCVLAKPTLGLEAGPVGMCILRRLPLCRVHKLDGRCCCFSGERHAVNTGLVRGQRRRQIPDNRVDGLGGHFCHRALAGGW